MSDPPRIPEPENRPITAVSVDDSPRRVQIDPASPSARSIVRFVVITLLLLFVAGFVQTVLLSLTYLFFLIVLSIFFAYLIEPLVQIIRRPVRSGRFDRWMPRPLAIFVAYIIVFTALGLGIANVAPIVVEQAKEFGDNLPSYGAVLRQRSTELNKRFDRLRIPEELQAKINERATYFGEQITASVGNFLLNSVAYIPWLILIPIIAFLFLKDVHLFRSSLLQIFPAGPLRQRAEAVMKDVNSTLAAYTRAQLFSCLLIGLICTIGFYFIGVRYALLFGIVAGVFEFVPLLGPITIGILVTTVAAFSDNPWRALYVAIFLIVLRLIHDYITYPRIVRGGMHLHPLAIILSVLAGEQVAGIPGVFLSIPIVAIVTVLYRHAVEHSGSAGLFAAWLKPKEDLPDEAL
ncbi:MAG: AI-2E family transporter [Pyrinomonadaceae bacterium]